MSGLTRTRAARGKDLAGGPRLHVVLVGPNEGLDVPSGASNNRVMDPVVIALAQLVRDRWEREQRDRANRRTTLRVVKVETK
jgi:hypothetical protein